MKLKRLAAVALFAVASIAYAESSEATGSVSGKVNGPNGQPLAGVTVKVVAVEKGVRGDAPAPAPGEKKKKVPSYTGTTDEQGRFRIADVPPGTYQVNATSTDVGRARGNATVVAGRDFVVNMQLQKPRKKA
ncbi:MAG TPA: carboxypeptidase-like regulatory domain-containing protein [Tepidisphaeraceae bacterium]